MRVRTRASTMVPRPREEVFAYAVACENLPGLFRGCGPIPAIEEATVVGGGTLATGCVRRIRNSDGSVVDEEILALEPPQTQRYRLVSGIKAPFSWLVRWGEGEWTFSGEGTETEVVWRYEFELTNPLAWPLAAPLVATFFRTAMQRCLARLRDQLVAPDRGIASPR